MPEEQQSAVVAPVGPVVDSNDEVKFSQNDLNRILSGRIAGFKEKAEAYDALIAQSKSDAEKQADALKAVQAENAALKASEARRMAASAAKLPAEAFERQQHQATTGSSRSPRVC